MEKVGEKVKKLQKMSHEEMLAAAEKMFVSSAVFETRRCEGHKVLYERLTSAIAGDAVTYFLQRYVLPKPCSGERVFTHPA